MTITHARRALTAPPIAAAGFALALVIIFASNYHAGKDENGGTGPALVTALGCLVVGGLLFGLVLPRTSHHSRIAVILGALAILTTVIFWSGVTPVLAAASIAATGGVSATGRGPRAMQLLAVLATAAAVTIALVQSQLF